MALQRPLLPLLLGLAGALRGATSGKPFQRPPSSPALHSVSPPRLDPGDTPSQEGAAGDAECDSPAEPVTKQPGLALVTSGRRVPAGLVSLSPPKCQGLPTTSVTRELCHLVCFFELTCARRSAVRREAQVSREGASPGRFSCQKNKSHRIQSVDELRIGLC